MKRIIVFILAVSFLLGITCPLCAFAQGGNSQEGEEILPTPTVYANDTRIL
jgi:hypothetical protein